MSCQEMPVKGAELLRQRRAVRTAGEIRVLAPPLILAPNEAGRLFSTIRGGLPALH
jgi:hypothetical protein